MNTSQPAKVEYCMTNGQLSGLGRTDDQFPVHCLVVPHKIYVTNQEPMVAIASSPYWVV